MQRFDLLPLLRGAVAVYARDLDGDGLPDRILETQRVRASFSGVDGRWMEWVWKDSNTNLLPDSGLYAGSGPATAHVVGASWEFRSNRGRRTVTLGADNRLTGYGGGLPRKQWLLAHEGFELPLFAAPAEPRRA